jgi:dTDP-L-rhamnose 4-epimerase
VAVVYITGIGGFIARHVVALLDALGHDVRGVDSLDLRVHKGKKPPHWRASWRIGDYCMSTLREDFDGVDIVIHLAAQVSVADSAVDPCRYIIENTDGTARMLLKVPTSVQRLVVASSMSVYGEGGELVTESAPVCPTSVYGLTKYDQERLCLMWGQQQQRSVAALRFFNVYGPGQSLDNPYTGVLANFAKRLLNDESPTVYEDGLQTRDFIHVEDVSSAIVKAALGSAEGVFNACTGTPTTVLHAAHALAEGLGKDIEPTITGTMRPGDIRHCTGDPTKAKEQLGFMAEIPFNDGIRQYAAGLRLR